jgi:hypothetical protein
VSEKIEQFWRDATADDVARVMDGQTVVVRVRDKNLDLWQLKELVGWKSNRKYPWITKAAHWQQCQVYDPPEWYINKPDPGEGFRLLEKFPHEAKLATDEAWQKLNKCWKSVINNNGIQADTTWYRRRIEINNPEIPDSCNSSESPNSCRSRDNIPSGWRVLGKDEWRLASDAYWSLGAKDWIIIGDDRVGVANELPKWHAIRRVTSTKELTLTEGFIYALPSGDHIRITAKGFEVV